MNSSIRVDAIHDFQCRGVEKEIDDDSKCDRCKKDCHSQPTDSLLILKKILIFDIAGIKEHMRKNGSER